MSDPVDEMREVLRETLKANALELVGAATHGAPVISERALDELARGLLARRVAEPSRKRAAPPSDPAAPLREAPYPTRPAADPLTIIARLAHGMHGGEDMECEEETLDDGVWCAVCWKYASDWMAADSTWNSATEVRAALAPKEANHE